MLGEANGDDDEGGLGELTFNEFVAILGVGYARKHRAVTSAVVFTSIVLVVSVIMIVYFAVEASRQREIAQQEAEAALAARAEAVVEAERANLNFSRLRGVFGELFGDLHGAEFRGQCATNPACDHDRCEHRTDLLGDRGVDHASDSIFLSERGELREAFQRENHADEHAGDRHHGDAQDTDRIELWREIPPSHP